MKNIEKGKLTDKNKSIWNTCVRWKGQNKI